MNSKNQMSARERISCLLDSDSFVEIGALITKRNTDFDLGQQSAPSDGVITGYGVIDSNPVYVYSQDISALNGTVGEMHAKKIAGLYEMAIKVGAPVIGLIDCGGLRLQEAVDALNGFGEIYSQQVKASGYIPQLTAVFGKCGGGVAISTALSDFSFAVKDNSQLFVNSPNTLMGNTVDKCNTASADYQAKAGNIDFVADTEQDALVQIRDLVIMLPSNNEDNVFFEEEQIDSLNRLTPELGVNMKDAALTLAVISDNNKFVEVKKEHAKEMVTGFIKLNGITIGAVANRSVVYDADGNEAEKFDSVLTTAGCLKAERFVRFCNAFNIPVLTLTDVAGFKADAVEEQTIAAAVAKLTYAFADTNCAKVNLITGKAYGSAYVAMNSKHIGADIVFAWTGTEVGAITSADMAAKIIYPDVNDVAVLNEKAAQYAALQSSTMAAAGRGYIDSIIEPETTRQNLVYAFEMLFTKREARLDKKHGTV